MNAQLVISQASLDDGSVIRTLARVDLNPVAPFGTMEASQDILTQVRGLDRSRPVYIAIVDSTDDNIIMQSVARESGNGVSFGLRASLDGGAIVAIRSGRATLVSRKDDAYELKARVIVEGSEASIVKALRGEIKPARSEQVRARALVRTYRTMQDKRASIRAELQQAMQEVYGRKVDE